MYNQTIETEIYYSSGTKCAASQPDYLELQLCGRKDMLRPVAERFIQKIFYKAYGAKIESFYPLLLVLIRYDGSFATVAGIRAAEQERLFLEHYLDQSVEEVIQAPRHTIVEIGNLAPADAGQARWLITTLCAFLTAAGFSHVVFTAVPRLRNAFQRMGLPLTELAKATPDHLSEAERSLWGNYYQNDPIVCVGDLRLGEEPLNEIARTDKSLEDLCHRAKEAGAVFREHLLWGSEEVVTE